VARPQIIPAAHIALLCDRHPGKSYVLASDLLRGSNIFDEYFSYPVSESGELLRGGRMATLLTNIRRKRFDTLVYLAPTNRTPEQIARDRRFFAIAGIRNFLGMQGFTALDPKVPGEALASAPLESRLLLRRLIASGLDAQLANDSLMDVGVHLADEQRVEEWLRGLPSDGGRRWVAIGPGSKMPAKRWPLYRFEKVVNDLVAELNIRPVVFGGEEDRVIGDWLLARWARGYNAAGFLGIRPSTSVSICVRHNSSAAG